MKKLNLKKEKKYKIINNSKIKQINAKKINKIGKIFFGHSNKIKNNVTKAQIKKIFNIIYQYHVRNKKILFIDVPKFIIKDLKKQKSGHFFISSNIWVNGFITNQATCFYSMYKKEKKSIKLFLKLKKKFDLIVSFENNHNAKIFTIIKESYLSSIPSIFFNNNFNKNKFNPTYLSLKISNFNTKFFMYIVLKSILKKNKEFKKNTYYLKKNFYFKKRNYNKANYMKRFIKKYYTTKQKNLYAKKHHHKKKLFNDSV